MINNNNQILINFIIKWINRAFIDQLYVLYNVIKYSGLKIRI